MGDIARGVECVVIGGGPGGYVAAIRLAQLGKEVVLIEKDPKGIGGICLNWGCIPTKALIYAANQYSQIPKLSNMGITVQGAKIDFQKLMEWKNANVAKLRNGVEFLLKKHNIDVIYGTATFESQTRIHIQKEEGFVTLDFKNCVLATGSRPKHYDGAAFDHEEIIDSTDSLKLKSVPKSMIIIGAGFIALENAAMFAKLGTKVTMVSRSVFARNVDADLLDAVEDRMNEMNITSHKGTQVERVKTTKGNVEVMLKNQKGEFTVCQAEKLLVAIGRKPNTDNLQLERSGVKINEKGFVMVDQQRKTSNPHIYAIGDITGDPMLAHKAFLEAKVAAEAICGMPSAYDPHAVPAVIFSDPEIATVGLSEQEAIAQGHFPEVAKFPFTALGRAVSVDKSTGFVKIISTKEGLILGIHIVGAHASDLISEASLGLEMGFTLEDLALTIHPHPTFPEALSEAAETALGRAIHLFQEKKKKT